MFYDLAVRIEPENINAGPIPVTRPVLASVQDNVIALRDHALKLDALTRILPRHAGEVFDEGFLTVGDRRVMPDVGVACIAFDGHDRPVDIRHAQAYRAPVFRPRPSTNQTSRLAALTRHHPLPASLNGRTLDGTAPSRSDSFRIVPWCVAETSQAFKPAAYRQPLSHTVNAHAKRRRRYSVRPS